MSGYYDEPGWGRDDWAPYGERARRLASEAKAVEPRFSAMDCPKCGTHTDAPRIHWVAAVDNSYDYEAAHMEVICGACDYAVLVYPHREGGEPEGLGLKFYLLWFGLPLLVLVLILIFDPNLPPK